MTNREAGFWREKSFVLITAISILLESFSAEHIVAADYASERIIFNKINLSISGATRTQTIRSTDSDG